MKKILFVFLNVLLLLVVTACGGEEAGSALSEDKLKVGVTAGPHEQILEKVKEVAAEDGLEIEIVVFNEYVMPNVALDEGDLDVNSFQHKPYLDKFKEDRDLDLVEIANTVNFPMGIYSSEIKDVSELKEGDKVGLPNDPTNGARALILFEQAGLIKLKEDADVGATVKDIEENNLNLEFVELEASQIPRQLDELAAAAINTNFAVEHGFVPTKDSIFIEPSDSPWVNLLAVRAENENDPVLEKLIKAYHSDEVKQFIADTFEGSVVASW
ncbi:MetQ/NlpA family ABC transporter substrate-binding protein [Sutcliffiella deserti]|uniref:MetQ/NlpA family ABC transporter substrate-binding protein n=1 Tax=Sutcliffiella deserti TaxID=2875501 RepID=UPI001CC0D2E5|nr:MetQ/NlpA family ABC transporter substrate-binding protein [Sutcliffiella deserti]